MAAASWPATTTTLRRAAGRDRFAGRAVGFQGGSATANPASTSTGLALRRASGHFLTPDPLRFRESDDDVYRLEAGMP